jgi:hypothetical protein
MTQAARVREQELTVFSVILTDVVKRIPGAFAAVLVDMDGECVDYAIIPSRPPYDVEAFDVKVAGAHWAIVLAGYESARTLGAIETIISRGERRSFIIRTLPDRYAIVLMLKKRAGFVAFDRALDACERALAQEASWKLPKGRGVWISVDVEMDERFRPVWLSMGALSCSVEVMGSLTSLRRRERGWRVRLPSGGELNLVREARNRWYADEKLG